MGACSCMHCKPTTTACKTFFCVCLPHHLYLMRCRVYHAGCGLALTILHAGLCICNRRCGAGGFGCVRGHTLCRSLQVIALGCVVCFGRCGGDEPTWSAVVCCTKHGMRGAGGGGVLWPVCERIVGSMWVYAVVCGYSARCIPWCCRFWSTVQPLRWRVISSAV